MKPKARVATAFGMLLVLTCLPGFAHHGSAAYNVEKPVTLKGTVTRWSWSNPHCLLQLDVADDFGQVVHWITETQNPLTMANLGWRNDMMKTGDRVTVKVMPAKNGRPIGNIVDITLSNGQKLNALHVIPGVTDDLTSKPDKPGTPDKPDQASKP